MTPADHAAWISARATVWAAVFTGMSAAGVLWGAYVATRAAKTWRGVHEATTADQCVAAAFECVSAVDRVISTRWAFDRLVPPTNRETLTFPTDAYNDAWVAWRRFQTAHIVAARYYVERLDTTAPDQIAEQISKLEVWCQTFYGRYPDDPDGTDVDLRLAADRASDEIRDTVKAVSGQVAKALRPAPLPVSLWSRARNIVTAAWARIRHP